MTALLLRQVTVGGAVVDVVVQGTEVHAIGTDLAVPPGAAVVEGATGALLPGLWDHHIHLVALAAARRSVVAGPPEVNDVSGLAQALRAGAARGPATWVRAVGYHESVAGDLDRADLDRLVPGVPVRLQHRSGSLWVLSSEAIRRLGVEGEHRDGLERGDDGRLTGRVYGLDAWLGERVRAAAPAPPPDLAAVGAELASYGVVGVTDATPYEGSEGLELLASASTHGSLPQHIRCTGGPGLAGSPVPSPLQRGPVKLRLADHAPPSLDQLGAWITAAHGHGRPVAVHCVTRESLVLTLAALDDVGSVPGDRIEHGSVVPPELHDPLRRHRLTVVTQPNFVAERGDRYLVEVDRDDQPHLYPCRGLLDAGIPVAGSTDAPFGHPDPWRAVSAAVHRRTVDGHRLGSAEAVPPSQAIDLFLGPADAPGGPLRRVAPGQSADLCLLAPLAAGALPTAGDVRLTVIGGAVVHRSD